MLAAAFGRALRGRALGFFLLTDKHNIERRGAKRRRNDAVVA
ncbi:hypothetical protein SAMN03159448_03965 [Sinorhizobium sp. NFACC03]|nr:hypothetical protein SAMN03159448_03965 [Sinorhizobium sp. NFACC03]